MALEGEGTTMILALIVTLVVILGAVILWQLIKKRRSVYTYAYQQK